MALKVLRNLPINDRRPRSSLGSTAATAPPGNSRHHQHRRSPFAPELHRRPNRNREKGIGDGAVPPQRRPAGATPSRESVCRAAASRARHDINCGQHGQIPLIVPSHALRGRGHATSESAAEFADR
jgi:hypothetical protein